ncbi:stretch-activated cation channel mid1 [Puccinia graminis f. sp. tritici]|uniref:Stretch-activated cation channel mid1 n=1 Tax=Puccinia graminis f. sp. tritici TaxID=56615 RepID=A0A5B0S0Q1_PUCGR|nr:stretch-activated cation channel mid1 [Puccinia graminis f. sp. tritici]
MFLISIISIICSFDHVQPQSTPAQLRSPSVTNFSLSNPLLFYVPPQDTPSLNHISLNLCSAPSSQPIDYQFNNILIVSNSSDNKTPSPDKLPARSKTSILSHQSSAGDYSDLRAGIASVSLVNSVGLWISIQPPNPAQSWSFQLGVSNQTPLHASNNFPALKLDDTDGSNALLTAADSSVFLPVTAKNPPSTQEFVPIILPTPDNLQLGLAGSLCYLQSIIANQSSESKTQLERISITPSLTSRTTGVGSFSSQPTGNATDHDYRISDQAAGLRTQYLINNLNPALNYSAWFFQPGPLVDNVQTGRLWPYINFRTKSSKNCRLVHDLPFCPSVAYAVPASTSQSTTSLVEMYNRTVSEHLANFRTVVSTYPCNNDTSGRYSFVTGCGDCLRAYTDWVCGMTMPRCTDPPPPPAPSTPTIQQSMDSQMVFTRTEPNNSRTPNLTEKSVYPYAELPPCGSLCTLVAATCPPLIGWNCPLPGVTSNFSYRDPRTLGPLDLAGGQQSLNGFGGERAQDRFGNVFCNALESDIVYARMGSANRILSPSSASALLIIITSHLLASFLSGIPLLPFL